MSTPPQVHAVLNAQALTRVFGEGGTEASRVVALDAVSLTIAPGELAALVGPSGSGKSTLMHLMGCLDTPTEGLLEINGIDVSQLDDNALSAVRAYQIGFVFQQFFLNPTQTAVENVADGLLYSGIARQDRHARAEAALQRVGLGDRLTHRPGELSGGQRQRVAIARAVVGNPPLVLADEPTGNLDSRSSAEVVELLHELNAEGTTIVVVTHDLELAEQFPRQIQLRDGVIVADEMATA
ncbi:MAG: ABC transporter ATP-binding protein [Actinomycetia bacterium]|nr:ABC transporter ATP-binding protein [Actinomycetes bacterium]